MTWLGLGLLLLSGVSLTGPRRRAPGSFGIKGCGPGGQGVTQCPAGTSAVLLEGPDRDGIKGLSSPPGSDPAGAQRRKAKPTISLNCLNGKIVTVSQQMRGFLFMMVHREKSQTFYQS